MIDKFSSLASFTTTPSLVYWPPEAFDSLLHPEQKPPYGSKLQRLVTQHKDNLCPLRALRFIQGFPLWAQRRPLPSIHPSSLFITPSINNVLILHSPPSCLCVHSYSLFRLNPSQSLPVPHWHASQRASDMMRRQVTWTRARGGDFWRAFERGRSVLRSGFPRLSGRECPSSMTLQPWKLQWGGTFPRHASLLMRSLAAPLSRPTAFNTIEALRNIRAHQTHSKMSLHCIKKSLKYKSSKTFTVCIYVCIHISSLSIYIYI